jgi:hypothetical protein
VKIKLSKFFRGRAHKSKCSVEELAKLALVIIFHEDSVNGFVKVVEGAHDINTKNFSWEIIVLRFFYIRCSIMQHVQNFKPAIDALHKALFIHLLQHLGKAKTNEMEEWMELRIADYTQLYNGIDGPPSDRIQAVGRMFADFAGLDDEVRYKAEYFQNLLSQAVVFSEIRDFLLEHEIC